MSKDKKIAILVLCHILPNQINDFIDILDDGHFDFFIHVDKKSDIHNDIHKRDNVLFVSDERRIDVRWGQYSMVEATLQLIDLATRTDHYDYYWLCSGQDFPIKRTDEIYEFLKNKSCNFISIAATRNNPVDGYSNTELDKRCEIVYPSWLIGRTVVQRGLKKLYNILTGGTGYTFRLLRRNAPCGLRLYFGSQWWCLNRETVEWVTIYAETHSEICEFYKKTLCSDESFFHTLVMNSPYADQSEPNLVFIDWSEGKSSPKVLRETDYEKIVSSGKLIARKIDATVDHELYLMLQSQCL